MNETAYVVRETRTAPDGRVVYELVDMAGKVVYVTLPHALTNTEHAHPVLRHALATRAGALPPE